MLEDKGVKTEIIEYLKTPPTEKQLKDLLKKLGIKAMELIRTKEELFQKKYKNKKHTEVEWVKILCKNPILIERPIAIEGNKAIIGRPAEKILTILK
jgi:arsenate reductase